MMNYNNTSNNTYLHYFNEEMFKSIRLIDWQNNDLYDSLSDILDQEQIISMITRDNIYRSKISKGIYDLEKILIYKKILIYYLKHLILV